MKVPVFTHYLHTAKMQDPSLCFFLKRNYLILLLATIVPYYCSLVFGM